MADPRVAELARLLVERSIGVQPGWQVLIKATAVSRPLLEEVVRQVARRGAYALQRVSISGHDDLHWWAEAPEEALGRLPSIDLFEADNCDARIAIWAPENTREPSILSDERRRLRAQAMEPLFRRVMSDEIPWVIVDYPCPSLAQDAGMSLGEFEEFLYGACLIDWDALAEEMRAIKERFDRAERVRIVGERTDLTLGLRGREGVVDDGHINMPGGEVYFGPVESETEGEITFAEFPAVYAGHEVSGARLVFRNGRVVEASADSGEDRLLATLDTDEGARVIGELGIGTNPGITRFMKNVAFDEKIAGTIHLALGESYANTGGVNKSAIHWDMVKDLRAGGRIECDGEVVQENGEWQLGRT